MQRREFIAAVGTAAAVAATVSRASATVNAAPEGSKRPPSRGPFTALEAAAGACIDAGEDCLRRCFGARAAQDTSMTECADAAYALIASCRAVKTLAAARSPLVPIFAKAVEQACIACRAECEKFPAVAECAACGDACAKCAEECLATA